MSANCWAVTLSSAAGCARFFFIFETNSATRRGTTQPLIRWLNCSSDRPSAGGAMTIVCLRDRNLDLLFGRCGQFAASHLLSCSFCIALLSSSARMNLFTNRLKLGVRRCRRRWAEPSNQPQVGPPGLLIGNVGRGESDLQRVNIFRCRSVRAGANSCTSSLRARVAGVCKRNCALL